ncbi:MAG: hypothetical protein ABSG25_12760 [Bryobacteraceae bacterium]
MKKRKRTVEKRPEAAPPPEGFRPWHYALAFAAACAAVFAAYGPALRGPFVFDDRYLPFAEHEFHRASLIAWMRGVRPFLMASYWLNYRISHMEPFSYHLVNVLLHLATGVLIFLIAMRLLKWAGAEERLRGLLALFAGGLFLLHPVQTESVAYVASRSEGLSVFFFYAAFALFLYRRSPAISWLESAGILLLFGAAVSTKEHAAALPLLLLLTDYFWNPGFSFSGIRKNWRVYALLAVAGAIALRVVYRILRHSPSAGFHIKEFTWIQYFYTECRAIWVYVRMFVLPYGQNVDHDFAASRGILDHGAVIGLAALIALGAAAIYFRRRYPLACYGILMFLLLLAPTSSFIPLADPLAERRLYLPFLGLLLVAVDCLRRWRVSRTGLAAAMLGILLVAGWLTAARAAVWGNETALWEDSVAKAPNKARPRQHLAYAYFTHGQCDAAIQQYEAAARITTPDFRDWIDWALADDCLHRWDEAIEKLQQAASIRQTAQVYALLGLVYGHQNKTALALTALDAAEHLDRRFEDLYIYRAIVYAGAYDYAKAADVYRRVLARDPRNEDALSGLPIVEQRLRAQQQRFLQPQH